MIIHRMMACLACLFWLAPPLQADEEAPDPLSRDRAPEGDSEPPPLPRGMTLAMPKLTLAAVQRVQSPTPPLAQAQLASSTMSNSDIGDVGGNPGPTDTLFVNSATLRLMPKIAAQTYLAADLRGAFIRYADDSDNDYNVLNANVGLWQGLGERMTGELGWRFSQYYALGSLTDLEEQGVRLAVQRVDPLPRDFFLAYNYEFQANFADPSERSRLSHYFRTGIGHNFTPHVQAFLDYSLRHDDYIKRQQNDTGTRHEFRGQLSYLFSDNIYVAGTMSYLLGDPVELLASQGEEPHDLSDLSFGVHLGLNWPLLD